MDSSFQGILQHHGQQMAVGFKYVFDAILKHSKLDIVLIRISSVTEASFHASFEARVSNTGPAKAILSPMTIELCGPQGCFGKLTLPEFNTTPGGAYIEVKCQLVEITDKAALLAFVNTIIKDTNATLSLKNGMGAVTVPSFGIGPRSLPYERDIPIKGMNLSEVSVKLVDTTSRPSTTTSLSMGTTGLASRTNLTVVFHVLNPSPVELSFSICEFEIRNERDELFAVLKGRLDMRSDYFDVTLYGAADKRVSLEEGKARLVGKRCAGAGWCDETVKGINVPISDVWRLRRELGLEFERPPPPPPSLFRWRGFWFHRP
ncbi:hypothetical protein F4781DRAFT_189606 [Annulohypoxylon bovei var. microspora]|nr:hypothetical protein F4781DRAFT_189606 [Annulohypoxylon bovei var. microspora]